MDNYIKTWLFDFIYSISEIDSCFTESKKFESYDKEIRTKKAVERNIEFIGEALNRILKENPLLNISNS